ncbi:MAG: hypothetical protein HYZ00_03965 [Candidatus Hydrogenedentes bacterium]|nr:hypothetical protein [Candidatus Hydrogenedentota bacterium]
MYQKRTYPITGPAVAVICALFSVAAAGQITVQPATITSHTYEPQSINLPYNGQPLPATAVISHKVYAGKNARDDFFTIVSADGSMTITPTQQAESGISKFIIQTTHGPVTVDVYTPFDNTPDCLENRAKGEGCSVEDLKMRLGLYTRSPRETITMTLPPTYYTGQTLCVDMEKTPGRTYTWRVNNQLVAQGEEANCLNYTFNTPGPYVIEYTESVGGVIVAKTTATTNVVGAPALSVGTNAEIALKAPEGYGRYVWKLDGMVLGEGLELRRSFKHAGDYTIVVEASQPTVSGLEPIKLSQYNVNVVEKLQFSERD